MKTNTDNTPKIYVGTYGKYNAGSIAGKWLDLTDYTSKEAFYEACKELHADETDPEFMFQDHENIPGSMVSESWIADNFWYYLSAMDDLSDDEKEPFELFVNNRGADLSNEDAAELIEKFREAYRGHFTNGLEDYAYDLVQECYFTKETPDIFKTYFDYAAFARDLELGGDYWQDGGHVFDNNI